MPRRIDSMNNLLYATIWEASPICRRHTHLSHWQKPFRDLHTLLYGATPHDRIVVDFTVMLSRSTFNYDALPQVPFPQGPVSWWKLRRDAVHDWFHEKCAWRIHLKDLTNLQHTHVYHLQKKFRDSHHLRKSLSSLGLQGTYAFSPQTSCNTASATAGSRWCSEFTPWNPASTHNHYLDHVSTTGWCTCSAFAAICIMLSIHATHSVATQWLGFQAVLMITKCQSEVAMHVRYCGVHQLARGTPQPLTGVCVTNWQFWYQEADNKA